jgi:hypothetical protein
MNEVYEKLLQNFCEKEWARLVLSNLLVSV